MKKEAMQEVAMGAALLLLAYAVYRQFRPAAGRSVAATSKPKNQVYTGSPLTAVTDVYTGNVYDVGGFGGRNYLNEIADPLVSGYDDGKDSVYVRGVIPWG